MGCCPILQTGNRLRLGRGFYFSVPELRSLQKLRVMDPPARKEKSKVKEPVSRVEKAKQKSAQQELKQRQRAEIYALNRVMTELEQQQFDEFCKQMQPPRE
ncbi:small vasohibin-binding protein isoform X1 [Suricata suricatta]|nr:small vasohibin-binding protein isoform X1 [Suricata suricatta]